MKLLRLVFAIIFLTVTSGSLFAQKLDVSKFKDVKPRSIGPAGMSGRVTAIDVVNSNPDIMYAGSASGGLWKSTSGGINWEPVFDHEATASIGSIAIQQSNPDVVWVGTGEGNPRNSLNGGYGIYKSLDGGKTWKLMGLEKTRHIHRIVINKDNPDIVFAAAIGSPWGEHPERGIYRTQDGGKTWKKVLYVDEKTGAADLVVDPSNSNKLIAAMWQHRRRPWTFTSGGPGSGLFITIDGGDTWVEKTSKDGLPEGDLGRIGLAIAANKPNIIYALIESKKNALYGSTDGGVKWHKINDGNDIGNRPFYYSDIFVDPKNENRIYSLYSRVNVSEDGGKSFKQLMGGGIGGVHPDHHAWWIHPDDPDFMMDGNDGGLNITHDGGKTWRFVDNLPVGQFYHVNVDNQIPYHVYGGMQDNGSWAGPAYLWKSGGIRNSYWQEVMFGDGFDVVPDPENPRYGYAMSQQGNVGRYDLATGFVKDVQPTHPDPDVKLRFNWNAAIAQDPFDPSTIYFGSQFLHKSTDKGSTWEIISPDLTTNDPEKQKQYESGGLTMDATGAENYTTIIAIAPSSVTRGVIWVGTDDGKVQLTRDGGKTWNDLKIPGMPVGSWVPQVRASTYNAGEAFVVVNNYRNFDYKPYLFRTHDYGKTWESLVSEGTVGSYTLCVLQDPVEKNLVFMGTDDGLYVSIDNCKSWTKWTNGFPTVSTMDLAIQQREADLVIGTFGRAFYVLDNIRPLREVASKGNQVLNQTVHVFQVPDAYQTASQVPVGQRFSADGIFSGENRSTGARITYAFNKPQDNKQTTTTASNNDRGRRGGTATTANSNSNQQMAGRRRAGDSLKFEFFNSSGKLIRTIKRKAPDENGVYIFNWNLSEDGPPFPSRSNRRRFFGSRSGADVLPGDYKVRLTYGDAKDSTMIKVMFDPRLQTTPADLKAIYDAQKEVEKNVALAAKVTDQLKEAIQVTDDYSGRMKKEDAKKYKDQVSLCKAAKDSLNSLMDILLGKEDNRQGITASPVRSVTSYIFSASGHLRSLLKAPGPTEKRVMEQAQQKLDGVVTKVNSYFRDEWPKYKAEMDKIQFAPVKEYPPLQK